jgi:hypothetical protein
MSRVRSQDTHDAAYLVAGVPFSTIISRKYASSINYPFDASNQRYFSVQRTRGVSTWRNPENVGKRRNIIHQLARTLTSLGNDLMSSKQPTGRVMERK